MTRFVFTQCCRLEVTDQSIARFSSRPPRLSLEWLHSSRIVTGSLLSVCVLGVFFFFFLHVRFLFLCCHLSKFLSRKKVSFWANHSFKDPKCNNTFLSNIERALCVTFRVIYFSTQSICLLR